MTGKQLQYEFDLSGQTAQKFSESLGIGRTKLYAQFKMPVVEGAIVIAFNKLKISDKIYEVTKLSADQPNKNERIADLPNNNLTLVPIKAQGGFLNGYENKAYIDILESYPFPWVKGRCFGFEVEGFSMVGDDIRASFYPGEWVVCTELESFTWLSKGKVYVFATINGICIKQFDKLEDNKFYLKSLNKAKEYEVKPIPAKEVKRAFHIERKISAI